MTGGGADGDIESTFRVGEVLRSFLVADDKIFLSADDAAYEEEHY